MENMGDELKPLMWCVQHNPEMPIIDQMKVLTILLEASDKLKPLYTKHNKEQITFLFRLGEDI